MLTTQVKAYSFARANFTFLGGGGNPLFNYHNLIKIYKPLAKKYVLEDLFFCINSLISIKFSNTIVAVSKQGFLSLCCFTGIPSSEVSSIKMSVQPFWLNRAPLRRRLLITGGKIYAFASYLVPLFQNESSMNLICMKMTSVSYRRFHEDKTNS